jgi:hypothetical protein
MEALRSPFYRTISGLTSRQLSVLNMEFHCSLIEASIR